MDLSPLLRQLITQKGKQIRKQCDGCSDREMTTSKLLNIPELQLHHLWHETKNPCWRWEVKRCTYDQNKQKKPPPMSSFPRSKMKSSLRKRKTYDPEIRSSSLRERCKKGPGWRGRVPRRQLDPRPRCHLSRSEPVGRPQRGCFEKLISIKMPNVFENI